jgi:DNA-binding FadR family transcriptional regulator
LYEKMSYLSSIEAEHNAIFGATKDLAPARARDEMRKHLSKSLQRYCKLAESKGLTKGDVQ